MVWQELFVGDYERDAVWMNMGLCFLDVLKKFSREKELKAYLGQYKRIVEEHQTFLEVFDSRGRPFRTLFYRCDAGMLWASKLVDLVNRES